MFSLLDCHNWMTPSSQIGPGDISNIIIPHLFHPNSIRSLVDHVNMSGTSSGQIPWCQHVVHTRWLGQESNSLPPAYPGNLGSFARDGVMVPLDHHALNINIYTYIYIDIDARAFKSTA